MQFLQSLCRETKTALLHIPPKRWQKDLNDFVTWIDNWIQTMEW